MTFIEEPKGYTRQSTEQGRILDLLTIAGTYSGYMPTALDQRTLDILNHKQVLPDTPEPILEDFLELYDVETPRGYRDVVRVQKKNIVCAMDHYQQLGDRLERLEGRQERLEAYLSPGWRLEGKVMNFVPSYKNRQFIAFTDASLDAGNRQVPFMAVNTDYIMDYSPL